MPAGVAPYEFIRRTRETGFIPGAQTIASVTLIAILIQVTTKWLAKKLDLLVEE
jgi:hypothetical protein